MAAGSVVELGAQRGQPRLGILERPLQAPPASVARGARRGAHPDPVVGHPLQGQLAAREERREGLLEEPLEERRLGHPEVGEGVVVDAHPAAQPAVGVVLLAQAREGACRAHPLTRRVQPQRHQDGRVDGRPARVALDGPDAGVEGGQVEPFGERPHQACPVVGGQQRVEVDRAEHHLGPVGPLQPRPTTGAGSERAFAPGARSNRVGVLGSCSWSIDPA